MKLKNVFVIVMLSLVSVISLQEEVRGFGPATIIKGIELLGKLIPADKPEEYIINGNLVRINKATYKNRSGYVFRVFDPYGQKRGEIFYFKDDENDMKEYAQFTKMSLLEKKRYIREDFLKGANFDLGPISPRLGDTAETVIAEFGKPDDSIPLYYEYDKVVSEMLIYYESPKKFLAVGIARGKVVRTQEFALSEGQGLKDALASAGITPATIPEPTPAPAKPSPLGTIPTTGFMPR